MSTSRARTRRPAAIRARRVAASALPGLSSSTRAPSSRSTSRRAPPPGIGTTVARALASGAASNGRSAHHPWLPTVRRKEKSGGAWRRTRIAGPRRSVLLRDPLVLDLEEHRGGDVPGRVVSRKARGAHALDARGLLGHGADEIVERLIDHRVRPDLRRDLRVRAAARDELAPRAHVDPVDARVDER